MSGIKLEIGQRVRRFFRDSECHLPWLSPSRLPSRFPSRLPSRLPSPFRFSAVTICRCCPRFFCEYPFFLRPPFFLRIPSAVSVPVAAGWLRTVEWDGRIWVAPRARGLFGSPRVDRRLWRPCARNLSSSRGAHRRSNLWLPSGDTATCRALSGRIAAVTYWRNMAVASFNVGSGRAEQVHYAADSPAAIASRRRTFATILADADIPPRIREDTLWALAGKLLSPGGIGG